MNADQVEDLASFIGEGVHTSLRKYCESEAAHRAWLAIRDMPSDEWSRVVHIVAEETVKHFGKDGDDAR